MVFFLVPPPLSLILRFTRPLPPLGGLKKHHAGGNGAQCPLKKWRPQNIELNLVTFWTKMPPNWKNGPSWKWVLKVPLPKCPFPPQTGFVLKIKSCLLGTKVPPSSNWKIAPTQSAPSLGHGVFPSSPPKSYRGGGRPRIDCRVWSLFCPKKNLRSPPLDHIHLEFSWWTTKLFTKKTIIRYSLTTNVFTKKRLSENVYQILFDNLTNKKKLKVRKPAFSSKNERKRNKKNFK